ncbi:sensor histidine kinase [Hymenobacter cellulosilyticus]|uniref:histidine kinase n=1 Tax=Hymenobacter cellulosilyticus TaxID=2932248 RepID=A0A8T9QF40_9BACT|nr:tetratricopeptide repeat protein [Hymenobacter cellulosilyticus]UOQ75031.1 ATP-binding protein [Hymenobacter cellulosilyticus]
MRYGLATVEAARRSHDTTALSLFYIRLGTAHQEINQLPEAAAYFELALRNAQQEHKPDLVLNAARHVAFTRLAQGQPQQALSFYSGILRQYPPVTARSELEAAMALAECYMALRRYDLAERYYLRILALDEGMWENYRYRFLAYQKIGSYYVKVRQYHKARRYLNQALTLNKQGGSLRRDGNLHLLLFKVDSAQHRYQQALAHYQRYKALHDSIFNEKKSLQIASLQIQYATKEKEQNIALLTKQNRVQQVSIQQKEFQRNAGLGGTLLLLLLSGAVYNRYRLKQRSNRLLEAKQAEINGKNAFLEQVLRDKEGLLRDKDTLLEEKEWMLKEIHHRVKNNLQIISSLLSSQAVYLQDPAALTAVRESQNRVHTMGLIHQNLYQSAGPSLVAMHVYIPELARHLVHSFNRQDSVRLELAVAPVRLDASLAVPVGLILNEALTNALKYAYPARQPGTVAISLQLQDGECVLTIQDTGIGMPAGFDPHKTSTLGLHMIRGLSRQIGGRLQLQHTGGVLISLQFTPVKQPKSSLALT